MNNDFNLQLFQSLLSSNNNERKMAEENFNKVKDLPFKDSIKIFLSGLESQDPKVQNITIVLMKKTYLDSKGYYDLIDDESKLELKKLIFSLVNFDRNLLYLNRLGDFLSKMYSHSTSNLSELLGYVVKTFESELDIARQFAIYIIESLCELGVLKDDIVEGSIENFSVVFRKGK